MTKKTLTAPLGIIKALDRDGNLSVIGKLRNVRVTEQFRRQEVIELGDLTPSELALVGWSGSLTASRYFIDLKNRAMNAPNRNTTDAESFANTLLIKEQGIQISLYKKSSDPNVGYVENDAGFVTQAGLELMFTIEKAFIEGDNIDLSVGQTAGNDQQFRYLDPVLALQ